MALDTLAQRRNLPPAGRCWKVVYDPTRTGEEPGVFYGGCFRWSDIMLPSGVRERIPCPFPNGTIFENVKTGERVIIARGKPKRRETCR